jgi:hypothetical protein
VKWIVPALAALALASCAPEGPTTPTPGFATSGFACPPAGARVGYSSGVRLTYRGTDPGDPDVCLATATRSTGTTEQRQLFNYWVQPEPGSQQARLAFARLYPLAEGKTTNFSRPGRTALQEAIDYQEDWRVLRSETIRVGNFDRRAWVLSRAVSYSMSRGGFRSERTLWFDAENGILLKQTLEPNGRSVWRDGSSYEATSLTLPGR